MLDFATIVSAAAGIASTASFAPQAWKIIRSGDVKSISAGMYTLTVTAFTLWTLFGFLSGSWPLILSNAICLIFSAFILAMKLMPGSAREKVKETLDPEA